MKRKSLCECTDIKIACKHILFESAPLEGGRTTSFTLVKCKGWFGFPIFNFEIAVKYGTPELHEAFENLGFKISK